MGAAKAVALIVGESALEMVDGINWMSYFNAHPAVELFPLMVVTLGMNMGTMGLHDTTGCAHGRD